MNSRPRSRLPLGAGAPVMALLLVLLAAASFPASADEYRCKKCGAVLEPGAAFCTGCGARIEEGAAPAAPARAPSSDARASVVQLVATHDREVTSTYGSIELGGKLKIESILGTAFSIAPGEFVTDAGLVSGAKEITLRTAGGKSAPATLKGIDSMIGVALLTADLPGVPPLPVLSGGPPRAGLSVTALGFPSGRTTGGGLAASSGVISGIKRIEMGIHSIEEYIQADASLPAGFAGGPVVDPEGRCVGMSTALPIGRHMILGPETGIGLSIPTGWIERALAWIRAGRPARSWIGVLTTAADAEKRKTYNLPPEVSRFVEYVYPGSPAESAGLRRGDGILSVEGTAATHLVGIQEKLLGASPGTAWKIEILREGKKTAVPVTLAARPEQPRLRGTEALRRLGGLELEARGTSEIIVSKVLPESEAHDARLKEGDVLKDLLTKKDLDRADKDNARWRNVKNFEDLEQLVALGYSDFDFYLGLRFRGQDGEKRYLYLYELLSPVSAI